MAQRKIIFFIIVGIIGVLLTIGILALNKETKKTPEKGDIKIWINEGTTEDFQAYIDGFKKFAPEYKNISITVEKKTEDTEKYRTLLLTAMSDNSGPDIFMVPQWEDAILSSQGEPIPGSAIDITDFESRFDSVFRDLIIQSGSTQFLKGVPLGYETLGVFYNKSLMRTGMPQNWNQVELLYKQFPEGTFPSNLGLGKPFVPNVVNILPLFLYEQNIKGYRNINSGWSAIRSYFTYGDLKTDAWENSLNNSDGANIYQAQTLRENEQHMRETTSTTLDMFMQGKIGFIVGYPSLITELEKSEKRNKSNITDLIFSEKIPQFSNKSSINSAKYNYFAISKKSENGQISAKFLAYLMSSDAGSITLNAYPHLIPAQIALIPSVSGKTFSKVLTKVKIDGFVPTPWMQVAVFDYGIKEKFSQIIGEYFRRNGKMDDIGSLLEKNISCEINTYNGWDTKGCDEWK